MRPGFAVARVEDVNVRDVMRRELLGRGVRWNAGGG